MSALAHERAIRARLEAAEGLTGSVDPDVRWLLDRVAALELAIVRVVQRADAMVAHHCGSAVDDVFCEEYGCGTLLDLVEPLRGALAPDEVGDAAVPS